jgi:hypothetical protein
MTRIMVWNIQFFTDENFAQDDQVAALPGQHIVDAIKTRNPDILVVIEVRSGFSGTGNLVTNSGGARGVRMLRSKLGANWYAVPPVVLNGKARYQEVQESRLYSEGIGVLYRTANVDFIGPWLWNGQTAVPRAPNATPASYAGVWANSLPATPPRGGGYGNLTQNFFAGQASYQQNGQPRWFPVQWGRNPFYTAFWDATANRVIKLLSVHLPPYYYWSREAMEQLGQMTDLTVPIPMGANQDSRGVRVILGDFNVNAMDPNQRNSYSSDLLADYGKAIDGTVDCATTIRRADPQPAPPFLHADHNWWGADRRSGYHAALDNILVQYYGQGGGPPQGFRICDWVPMRPSGQPVFPNAYMADAVTDMLDDDVFVDDPNYGKMRGASDHLGLYIEV